MEASNRPTGAAGKKLQRLPVGEECNTATQTQELNSFWFVAILKAGQLTRLKTF